MPYLTTNISSGQTIAGQVMIPIMLVRQEVILDIEVRY